MRKSVSRPSCQSSEGEQSTWAFPVGLQIKVAHSTESALFRVKNDILSSIDDNNSVVLLMLDLSAEFDTVDHQILLQRLLNRFGIVTLSFWLVSGSHRT